MYILSKAMNNISNNTILYTEYVTSEKDFQDAFGGMRGMRG